MRERRKWKNVATEDGKKLYRRLNNELQKETDEARSEYMDEKWKWMKRIVQDGTTYCIIQGGKEI